MLEPITATLTKTEDDYLAAFAARDANQVGSLRRLALIFIGLAGIFVVASWPVSPGLWTIALPLLVTGVLLLPANTRRQARSAYRGLAPGMREVTLTLTQRSIREQNDRYERTQPWSVIREWKETPELIVLIYKIGGVEVWPKEVFDPEDLAGLRGLLDAATPIVTKSPRRRSRKPRRWVTLAIWAVLTIMFLVFYVSWRGAV